MWRCERCRCFSAAHCERGAQRKRIIQSGEAAKHIQMVSPSQSHDLRPAAKANMQRRQRTSRLSVSSKRLTLRVYIREITANTAVEITAVGRITNQDLAIFHISSRGFNASKSVTVKLEHSKIPINQLWNMNIQTKQSVLNLSGIKC